MGNFGIRISEEGFDVNTPLTATNKKDFVFLSEEGSPKVYYAGFLEGTFPVGVSYTHNLGYVPMFFLYSTDSVTEPTYFSLVRNAHATTTQVVMSIFEYAYLIILVEGN